MKWYWWVFNIVLGIVVLLNIIAYFFVGGSTLFGE